MRTRATARRWRSARRSQDAEVASKTIAEKGLLIVHTGPGKGKSTAAFGLALRALGRGWRVGVVQFIKGAWETGERLAFERFGEQMVWRTMGEGFTWETQDRARDVAAAGPRGGRRGDDGGPDDPAADPRRTQRRAALRLSAVGRSRGGVERAPAGFARRRHRPQRQAGVDRGGRSRHRDGPVKHHFAAGVKAQAGIEFEGRRRLE